MCAWLLHPMPIALPNLDYKALCNPYVTCLEVTTNYTSSSLSSSSSWRSRPYLGLCQINNSLSFHPFLRHCSPITNFQSSKIALHSSLHLCGPAFRSCCLYAAFHYFLYISVTCHFSTCLVHLILLALCISIMSIGRNIFSIFLLVCLLHTSPFLMRPTIYLIVHYQAYYCLLNL